MKLIWILAVALAANILTVNAQEKGTIIYEQVINIHKSLSPSQKAMKALVPETISKKFSLAYNADVARLKEMKEETPGQVMIQLSSASANTLVNLTEKTVNSYFDLDEEIFYTEEAIEKIAAKATGEEKKILGYNCKAYATENDKVWVCHDLPANLTPLSPLFFDGAVLAIEGDKISYKALEVKSTVSAEDFEAPEAMKVTTEQAEDLQEEKINALKQMAPKRIKK